MKLGVFGDSYAERHSRETIFWQCLRAMGHEVESWGASGSSIMYSARLIQEYYSAYELVIWCLTTPGRFSVRLNDHEFLHVTDPSDQLIKNTTDPEHRAILQACRDYKRAVFEWQDANLEALALVRHMQREYPRMLIVPTFPPPLYTYPNPIGFNLYHLSEREARYHFPGQELSDLYQHWDDHRPGHLTAVNSRMLAEKINQQLEPGVFSASYDDFQPPSESFSACWQPRK